MSIFLDPIYLGASQAIKLVNSIDACDVVRTDSATTTASSVLRLRHNSTGTPGAGFGTQWTFKLHSSTTQDRDAAFQYVVWDVATDASRRARMTFEVADAASSRECLRLGTDGSAATIGFLGATAVVRQTGDAGTALVTLGLMSGTPTFAAANLSGTALPSGLVATQSDQETATSTALAVTPGRQQYHPSAAKAWVRWDASSGTPTIVSSYNVTSLTDNGVGDTTINFTTAFSNANYGWSFGGSSLTNDSRWLWHQLTAPATGSFRVGTTNSSQALADAKYACAVFFGDQ